MATKREVMLAGVPAKLAHMLASDQPNVLAAQGSDQAGASVVETNFQVIYGGEGAGVRLRPASGQFLHFLFNGNFYTVAVYPDGDEYINDIPPGQPFLLEAFMSGVFAPARRQWIAGQLAGSGAQGAVPNQIPGPLGIGTDPPADAVAGELLVGDVLTVAPGSRPGAAMAGRMSFNAYLDSAGTWRYLEDGAAGLWRFEPNDGSITYNEAVPGLAGQPIAAWTALTNPLFRIGMPGSSNGSRLLGPVGLGRDSPLDALVGQVFAAALSTVSLSLRPGTAAMAGRFTFNAYWDTAGQWRYLDNGPALLFRYDATTGELGFFSAAAGTAGAAIASFGDPTIPNAGFLPRSTIANGQTTLKVSTNEAGTVLTQQVLIGPAGSGPGGSGRALYVAT